MAANVIEDPAYRERVLVFKDRLHAGKLLSKWLRQNAEKENVVLLALPAGGVPEEFHVKATSDPQEIKELIEVGFKYVCEKDDLMFFRKLK
jgi:hypothetical protein